VEDIIGRYNPWWFGERDHDIDKWSRMKVKWIPKWIDEISLKPFSLNIVVGPRQVGKTTGIKLLISKLLKTVDSYRVFYFNCDFTPDMNSLRKIIEYYFSIREARGLRRESCYIFLDEIGNVPGWWRVIKGFIDLGLFDRDVLTLTGSSTLRLKGEIELFPGRRGFGRDIVALPLSFKDYAEVFGVKIDLTGRLSDDLVRASIYKSELSKLFNSYISTGGFPLAVNNDPRAEEYYIFSLQGEILRLNKRIELVKGIISSLMEKCPSPVSYSTIGREIGVSYKTVQEYIDALRSLYVLEVALFREGRRVIWRKERKFFFIDPFIANTLSHWTGEKYLESAIYEWIIQSHLYRRFGEVYYYRGKFEIDCIANELKIEVKAGKPHRKYPRNVLIVDEESMPIFLYALGT